ncbi:MGH1-like glycoside hydrolase domain-containing protein [Bordetella genomosp. 10]|uniref:MGH1-like glycoside hydrolase domain-containing protein n=1 Tax=Bordetella genomosp. 10 TaxID=1416804 RepID=UPI00211AC6CB|nr:glucosidase [Bordetella genomosp. 10]
MPFKLPPGLLDTVEGKRLHAADKIPWRRWGPYLSDRQWGTVREDYSEYGTAWDYFPHDHARSRAYRWGEDGIAGFGDEKLRWCVGLALWNGRDPIIKERLFGLNNEEGNHGEDVKELYFHLDATPTHSYMRMMYRYPQAAFPYADLVAENARRGPDQVEYEILDTGVFDDQRYFDVFVEYAKHAYDDITMRVTVHNRADEAAELHLLPQFWARNTWSWDGETNKPSLRRRAGAAGDEVVARHGAHEPLLITAQADPASPLQWLFCENETNVRRLFGSEGAGPFKDGFNDYLVHGDAHAVRRDAGTRAAAHVKLSLDPGGCKVMTLRWRPLAAASLDGASAAHGLPHAPPPYDVDALFAGRRAEADAFYACLQQALPDPDARLVQRQALAGLLWSKQYYEFDVSRWLDGDPAQPAPPARRKRGRNADWRHLANGDVISMPDKWEYPWYASWDLAFQAAALALVDPSFAKQQLLLLVKDRYQHPNGQLPAYEWAFGDGNPPVHAWAAWRVYEIDRAWTGRPDHEFLELVFHKLLLNFGWWVNRRDADGHNIFQGGFLGLDNVGIFDRSAPLPTGGHIDQSDGTAWMAAYALDMMRIALELATVNKTFVDIGVKFFEHFLYIASAVNSGDTEERGLWDEEDEFFYDALHLPDGSSQPMRVRSIVGLIPLFAVHVLEERVHGRLPGLKERLRWFLRHRPDLARLVSRWTEPGVGNAVLLSLLRGHRTKALLRRALDADEFLSDHGVRALSRYHREHPFVYRYGGDSFGIRYLPGEADGRVFGGNSNWRGPVWLPVNYLLIESLHEFHRYYGDEFRVEYPTGSGQMRSLREIANALSDRVIGLFLRDASGRRPSMAGYPALQGDPMTRDMLLFHEYFHGDDGRGMGASHQTGWTSLVALLLQRTCDDAIPDVPDETESIDLRED